MFKFIWLQKFILIFIFGIIIGWYAHHKYIQILNRQNDKDDNMSDVDKDLLFTCFMGEAYESWKQLRK